MFHTNSVVLKMMFETMREINDAIGIINKYNSQNKHTAPKNNDEPENNWRQMSLLIEHTKLHIEFCEYLVAHFRQYGRSFVTGKDVYSLFLQFAKQFNKIFEWEDFISTLKYINGKEILLSNTPFTPPSNCRDRFIVAATNNDHEKCTLDKIVVVALHRFGYGDKISFTEEDIQSLEDDLDKVEKFVISSEEEDKSSFPTVNIKDYIRKKVNPCHCSSDKSHCQHNQNNCDKLFDQHKKPTSCQTNTNPPINKSEVKHDKTTNYVFPMTNEKYPILIRNGLNIRECLLLYMAENSDKKFTYNELMTLFSTKAGGQPYSKTFVDKAIKELYEYGRENPYHEIADEDSVEYWSEHTTKDALNPCSDEIKKVVSIINVWNSDDEDTPDNKKHTRAQYSAKLKHSIKEMQE